MSKNYNLPDYIEHHFTMKEGLLTCLEGAVLVGMIGYFFYRSFIACVLLFPVFVLFVRERKKDLAKKCRQELSVQFKDLVLALSAPACTFLPDPFSFPSQKGQRQETEKRRRQ